jgi:hypothetical protein
VRIGATKVEGSVANEKTKHHERRVDSPRIGGQHRHESDSLRRGTKGRVEGDEEEDHRLERDARSKQSKEATGEQKERPEEKATTKKEGDEDGDRHESDEEAEENDSNGDDPKGDGQSVRRYTFTQGRCYWLVTQLGSGAKALKRKDTGPSTCTRAPDLMVSSSS